MIKENQSASPGYYQVSFDNYQVKTELTATPRVGVHKYTFAAGAEKKIFIDLSHVLQSNWGHKSTGGSIEILNEREIRGAQLSSGWAYDHRAYFHAQFSAPFEVIAIKDSGVVVSDNIAKGKNLRTYLKFDSQEPIYLKVGISPVSEAGALANLQAEMPTWDFDQTKNKAEKLWREALSVIDVQSQDEDLLKIFYTSLYHTHIAPMLYQDVDGQYRGMDKQVHQAEEGFTNYTAYSLWDTFRAWNPLMTIINPDFSTVLIKSLLRKYEQGGVLPKWPLAGNYTGTMVGYPGVAVIADALSKNITGFDQELALEASVHASLYHDDLNLVEPRGAQVSPKHLDFIERMGFIPADSLPWSVSYGLECAYYDWCIAQTALSLGDSATAKKYLARSAYYQNYYSQEAGFMRGKVSETAWRTPFSPAESDFNGDFIEGNSWQWSWFAPHDISGMSKMIGGEAAFVQKLNDLFAADSQLEGEEIPEDISGLIGQYAHGNEPSHHVTHLYNYLGQPPLAQEKINDILLDLYTTKVDGVPGNEDCGQMSAWYVMNAIGFYQVCPGKPEYSIGRPLFDEVKMNLGNGKAFTVRVKNQSKENKYVSAMRMNGETLETPLFTHEDIVSGGLLEIEMSAKP